MLRPKRLPCGYSNIIVGVLYHPPGTNNIAMKDHLIIIIINFAKGGEGRSYNCNTQVLLLEKTKDQFSFLVGYQLEIVRSLRAQNLS